MAVMMDQMPIGEVILKDINAEAKQCTLSIHMQNDPFKKHVLEKVGFQKTGSDEQFVYYRCDKEAWCRCHRADNPGWPLGKASYIDIIA